VVRYTPDGEVDVVVELPKALNVTCCVFGGGCQLASLSFHFRPPAHRPFSSLGAPTPGPDLSDLFITTATATENSAGSHSDWPQGGDLFKVRMDRYGFTGVERSRFGASV
jgi:sugar lactone lactonase YvrE